MSSATEHRKSTWISLRPLSYLSAINAQKKTPDPIARARGSQLQLNRLHFRDQAVRVVA